MKERTMCYSDNITQVIKATTASILGIELGKEESGVSKLSFKFIGNRSSAKRSLNNFFDRAGSLIRDTVVFTRGL